MKVAKKAHVIRGVLTGVSYVRHGRRFSPLLGPGEISAGAVCPVLDVRKDVDKLDRVQRGETKMTKGLETRPTGKG